MRSIPEEDNVEDKSLRSHELKTVMDIIILFGSIEYYNYLLCVSTSRIELTFSRSVLNHADGIVNLVGIDFKMNICKNDWCIDLTRKIFFAASLMAGKPYSCTAFLVTSVTQLSDFYMFKNNSLSHFSTRT